MPKTTKQNKAQVLLQTLPVQDRKILGNFFELLLDEYDYAYTLFGDKPVSVACYGLKPRVHSIYNPHSDVVFKEGWKTWDRYSHQFVSKQFVIKKNIDNKSGLVSIYLINKSAVLNTIKAHSVFFQHHLGTKIDAEELTEELCHPDHNFYNSLNNSELYGILLGYGQENAWKFGRKVELCHLINAKMNPPLLAKVEIFLNPLAQHIAAGYGCKRNQSFPEEFEVTLVKEYNTLITEQAGWELEQSDYFLDKFIAPVYMSSKEGLQQPTQVDFAAIRENIRKHYQQGDFLEITLNQFMDPQ